MKNMLHEYGIAQDIMTLCCDNITKHVDIRHHFIRELIENKIITLEHVCSNLQVADTFTKPLDANTFEHLRAGLGVCKI